MGADEKLKNLNGTLGEIESKLVFRALDRSRREAEDAFDFVNRAVEAGFADIECGDDCGDTGGEAGGEMEPVPEPETGNEEEGSTE
jgi:hypothetical protein